MATRLSLTGLYGNFQNGDDDWGNEMNENLGIIDSVLSGVIEATLNTPPGSPQQFVVYRVGTSPSGDFAGKANKLVFYRTVGSTSSWIELVTPVGSIYYDKSSSTHVKRTASGWEDLFSSPKATIISSSTTVTNAHEGTLFSCNSGSTVYLYLGSDTMTAGATISAMRTGTGPLIISGGTVTSDSGMTTVKRWGRVDLVKTGGSSWLMTGDVE